MPWRNYWAGQRKGRSRGRDILRGLGMGLWRGDWVGSNYVVVCSVSQGGPLYNARNMRGERKKCLTVFPFEYDP